MNIGDDVTINGVIAEIRYNKIINESVVRVKVNSGYILTMWASDINTTRPKIEIPDKDERRGN